MTKIIERYTKKLIANGIIKSEDKELYAYGFHQGLIIIANILTTILVGFIFGMIWQSIVFMMAYIPLRSFAGGFHAKTQLRCYVYSVILTATVLLAVRFILWTNFTTIGLALALGVIIFTLAPVEDKNKPLDKKEFTVYRKRTRMILSLEIVVIAFLVAVGLKAISAVIVISIFTLAVMLIAGKVLRDIFKDT